MPKLPLLFNHQRYDATIQQALLKLGLESLKPWLSLLLAVLLVLSCSTPAQRPLALCWLALAAAATVFGSGYCQYWRRRLQQPLSPLALKRAERLGVVYGGLVAVLWGSSSQFMLVDQTSNLMIAMIYFGVCAGAAAMSVLGMAHMGTGALLGCVLFILPLRSIFPDNWMWFTAMVGLYHFVIVMSSWQRHQIVARNLLLAQEQERLLHYQRQETRRANKANQDKSSFLAAASHDLRQPVHAIMLLGHALKLKSHDEAAMALVDQMLTAGRALSDQFNSLMELSRLESGNYVLVSQTTTIDGFLRHTLEAFQGIATSKNIRLRLRIGWQLKQAQLQTDLVLLGRILSNLIDNAIKFSPAGAAILLRAQYRDGLVRLAVQDQGPGIPSAEQTNIFQPYVQLNNPTRERNNGIGLGLSIVKEAANCLQAELTMHSNSRRGSCFMLTLSAASVMTSPPSAGLLPRARVVADSECAGLAGKHLLIVEDDLLVASALRAWAELQGMSVQHYADPADVPITLVADLVVCDIRLPGKYDGIHWLSQWLAEWPEAGGVLVSGEAGEEVQERAEQEGLLLLMKPVDPSLLLQTLLSLTR